MINQVTLVGRLTRDPELKTTADGTHVTQVNLAVNRNFRNHNGEIETDFISCTLWRGAAENTAKYCRKGSVVGVTGRLQTRHYDNRDGRRVYVTDVVAETIRFLSSKSQIVTSEHQPSGGQQRQAVNSEQQAPRHETHVINVEQQAQAPVTQEERKEEVSVGF